MANQPWPTPPIDEILDEREPAANQANVLRQKRLIEKTLAELGYDVKIRQVQQGPRLTRYNVSPESAAHVSKIKNLDQDLAVALSGATVQMAQPTPQNPALGILVLHPRRQQTTVKLRPILESAVFRQMGGFLKVGLGLDLVGEPVVIDLTELPHLLIGGTTGSGKSTCLHAILASLLCTYSPNALQLLLIDPLAIELRDYTNLPHLFAPVVTRSAQALDTLNTIDKVIERRYQSFADIQVRNIAGYNQQLKRSRKQTIPYIVVAIDNVFDLLMTSAKAVEQTITRMAQRARGAGVHLILSTPRADTDALSGTLKANFPGRIAFRVTDAAESRLILDKGGAEELVGQGDMLYKAPNSNLPQRIQGAYVSEEERRRIVEFWKS
ncbi:MAG: DNA translocase FtsK [Anaerolineae bacterium]|nr:DNA translocase FtsK [Anaerolineae bacterium]